MLSCKYRINASCVGKVRWMSTEVIQQKMTKPKMNLESARKDVEQPLKCDEKQRVNYLGIQMLPESLWRHVFPDKEIPKIDTQTEKSCREHLKEHGLWGRKSDLMKDVNFELPQLEGLNIAEHFENIGAKYSRPYVRAIQKLLESKDIPDLPKKWILQEGWTKYCAKTGKTEPVLAPEYDALIFDVETCVLENNIPVMATALSATNWYSWCSKRLIQKKSKQFSNLDDFTSDMMIPLEQGDDDKHRIIIGHNVGFDRSYVREQYNLKCSKTRFLDTLSMHVCVSGLTSAQRAIQMSFKFKGERQQSFVDFQKVKFSKSGKRLNADERMGAPRWSGLGSLNSLFDVYYLYCKKKLSKAPRDYFVKGTMDEIRDNFDMLMMYCAKDVLATFEVTKQLFPLFQQRFPNPVTFYGTLEMLTAYLPVDKDWKRYINDCDMVFDDKVEETELILRKVADRACSKIENEEYKRDVWLWDLDWKTDEVKFKLKKSDDPLSNSSHLYKRQPFMVGYPAWYRELCTKYPEKGSISERNKWEFGASNISTQKRDIPKLLKLLWDGYPLHYCAQYGWGYLIPNKLYKRPKQDEKSEKSQQVGFPLDEYLKLIKETRCQVVEYSSTDADLGKHLEELGDLSMGSSCEELRKAFTKKTKSQKETQKPDEPKDIGLPGVLFMKLPHKDGPANNVGNPLGKDFLAKAEGNVLSSYAGDSANKLLKLSKEISYWKNSRDRITQQMVVWDSDDFGVILPRVMPAGTVSRRAVERTWLTASNARKDRIGSELKAMVRAPDGYHFVGADVDSQELWIAAVLGDSNFCKVHGCTAFGWMTLQGKKSDGTDMHSRTAQAAGCTRDQAKILNYARIYGAGKNFAARLLQQFNHKLTESQAMKNADNMMKSTKGVKKTFVQDSSQAPFAAFDPSAKRIWVGGTESHMFNKLEEIANSEHPKTPFLECSLSRSLEKGVIDDDFITSRVNWVVQSSAVDYLHLMLLSMRYFLDKFGIDGRFVVSIHDEVRFMVRSEDRYRTALALHITNLYVRSLFAYKLSMYDLPLNVAFFSAVDVDKVLRKEIDDDCVTPSNPRGLEAGYGVPRGESLDIYRTIELTGGKLEK